MKLSPGRPHPSAPRAARLQWERERSRLTGAELSGRAELQQQQQRVIVVTVRKGSTGFGMIIGKNT